MYVRVYKRSSIHSLDMGVTINVKEILSHIRKGGTVKAENWKKEDVTNDFLQKLIKRVRLDDDFVYHAIRNSKQGQQ